MTGCKQFGGKRGGGERMLVRNIWIQEKRYFPWVVIGSKSLFYEDSIKLIIQFN